MLTDAGGRQHRSAYISIRGQQHLFEVGWGCQCRPRYSKYKPDLTEVVIKMTDMHPYSGENLESHAVLELLCTDT